MRSILCVGLIGALAFHGQDALALNPTFSAKQCNGCTAAQREQAAIGNGGASGTMRYVDDLTSGVLYKYMVEREPIAGGWAYYVTPQPVEPEYQDVVDELKAIWDLNNHHLNYTLHLSTAGVNGPAQSAFDVVDPGAGRNNTINYVKVPANWPVGQSLIFHYQLLIGSAFRILQGTPIIITIEVGFPDGSQADFAFDYSNNTVTYVQGSAQDSKGNPIPESVNDIVRGPGGTNYDFRDPIGNDWPRAIQRFTQWGIPITRGAYYACTKDPMTGVHCAHIY
jgi:hypothetical protein